jgi:Nif-specific regulatory protein
LKALVRLSTEIVSTRGVEAIKRRLIDGLLEILPAESAAILLLGKDGGEYESVLGGHRASGRNDPVRVSEAIARQVAREGRAIVSREDSRSVLAVPLSAFDRRLGVIYLESSDPETRFNEGHVTLATVVALLTAIALENARHTEWLETENRRLKVDAGLEHNLIGESSPARAVLERIAKIAPTAATVLILGESGTGKELVARAIHRNSARAGMSFVAINCAALHDTLLESELFGHERGAFTGAIAQKKGRLETADGGTVFLDEIAELAPPLQAKLLRVIQEREFERVGGTRPIRVDFRLIAATNKNLREAVRLGTFREDLYYRLNVVSLLVPPLRERREDIPLLANYFVSKHGPRVNRHVVGISAAAEECIVHYDWPGNVRELENAIEHAVVLGTTDVILPEDLPEALLEAQGPSSAPALSRYHETILEAKRQLILRAYKEARGNHRKAAKLIGLDPHSLHRLIRNMNLRAALKK